MHHLIRAIWLFPVAAAAIACASEEEERPSAPTAPADAAPAPSEPEQPPADAAAPTTTEAPAAGNKTVAAAKRPDPVNVPAAKAPSSPRGGDASSPGNTSSNQPDAMAGGLPTTGSMAQVRYGSFTVTGGGMSRSALTVATSVPGFCMTTATAMSARGHRIHGPVRIGFGLGENLH